MPRLYVLHWLMTVVVWGLIGGFIGETFNGARVLGRLQQERLTLDLFDTSPLQPPIDRADEAARTERRHSTARGSSCSVTFSTGCRRAEHYRARRCRGELGSARTAASSHVRVAVQYRDPAQWTPLSWPRRPPPQSARTLSCAEQRGGPHHQPNRPHDSPRGIRRCPHMAAPGPRVTFNTLPGYILRVCHFTSTPARRVGAPTSTRSARQHPRVCAAAACGAGARHLVPLLARPTRDCAPTSAGAT